MTSFTMKPVVVIIGIRRIAICGVVPFRAMFSAMQNEGVRILVLFQVVQGPVYGHRIACDLEPLGDLSCG